MRVVLDTNVLVAATRSRQGASFALVSSIPAPGFQICLSVGLYTEYTITHNVKDYLGSETLGITAISPAEFLNLIRPKI
jgi:predicted nucleic acid-binding protein